MRLHAWVAVLGALVGSGCELLPAGQDAGLTHVPGTYHLARGTPGHTAHLALTGEKKVECHDCHAIADAGFEAPTVAICQHCHEDQEKQHHPFPDGGVADGGQMNCLSCHVFRATGADTKFERWACMTCHATQQGEKAPITIHLGKCPECHHPHDAPFTKPADCSKCHQDVTLTHGSKNESLATNCLGCHPPHTPASKASGQCLSCHTKPTIDAKARVAEGALFTPGHPSCGTCHVAHTFLKQQVKSCVGCHADQVVLASRSHTKCTSCHQQHADHAAPKTCVSCHEKTVASLKHPLTVNEKGEKQKCAGCHPPHEKLPEGALAVACVSCHTKPVFTASVVHDKTTSCTSCHTPHGGKPKNEVLCVSCHAAQVALVKKNPGHAKCENCHAGMPHGGPVEPKACLVCHEKSTPPQAGHKDCASCHESHSATVTKTCATCHLSATSPKLPGLHAEAKHGDCKNCHAPHEPQPGFGPASCMSCHKKLSVKDHPTAPTQCKGCHLFKEAK